MPDLGGELITSAHADFQARYGREPQWTVLSPGRVNLIGDHTDYTGGLALPFAVDLYTVVCAAPSESGLRMSSSQASGTATLATGQPPEPAGRWTDYVAGVVAAYLLRGREIPALDIHVAGNLPLGAGLSSSAALELAVATLLEQVLGLDLALSERALLCQRVEHEYAGVPCGILDQFAIAFARQGQLLRLDCRDQSVAWIAFPAELALLVLDSGVRHSHTEGAYGERRRQCEQAEVALGKSLREAGTEDLARLEDPVIRARAHHVVTENLRVDAFVAALDAGDHRAAGAAMIASHKSLSDDFEVSCEELDYLVAEALAAGAIGARMTGGGFGGSIICLLHPGELDEFAERACSGYRERFGLQPTPRPVYPVAGPRVL